MQISYQLYSSRNFPPLENTIKLLSEQDVKQVEGFGGCYGDDPSKTVEILNKYDVKMTTGHFGMDSLEDDFDNSIATAKTFGMETILSPYILEEFRPNDAEGWKGIGLRLADLEKKVNDAGFKFGWHNHDFELVKLEDGSTPLDCIFDCSETLEWEADIAWVIQGNADPIAEIKKFKDRITVVHVKDIAKEGECTDEDGWADIGHGTVDWVALLNELKNSPVRQYILEHDNPNDHERFIKRSLTYLRSL